MSRRVLLIGVGGASCSGKTTLAKHLREVLPNSLIIHQDDFAPPAEAIPFTQDQPAVQDWDDPPTCILWEDFRGTLTHVKRLGTLPPSHQSHDHLNEQVPVGVDEDSKSRWKSRFEQLKVVWVIVDGFVLYWDPIVRDALDVKMLLRVPRATLQQRREKRQTYVLQNPDDAAAGGVWVDPPNYFSRIVWPGYVKAHQGIFEDGDVENGRPLSGITLLEPLDGDMTDVFEAACKTIIDVYASTAS
ncbi:hypothetical protein DB88DRAFT_536240 [Papiliotrema laurentii]|uniref:P-loop containing nucleoside triphosphate hydrolase protein n=1 Tax=Papiliotrema laurentii TaxID=5418 RepID=A0AAD9CWR4_PAPLA|nr:hypothetical protein DB88DRAFT_536240 [Papiliotrema laurentii]